MGTDSSRGRRLSNAGWHHLAVLRTFADHIVRDDPATRRVLFDLSYVPAPDEPPEATVSSDFNVLTPLQEIKNIDKLGLTGEELRTLKENCAPWIYCALKIRNSVSEDETLDTDSAHFSATFKRIYRLSGFRATSRTALCGAVALPDLSVRKYFNRAATSTHDLRDLPKYSKHLPWALPAIAFLFGFVDMQRLFSHEPGLTYEVVKRF